MSADIDEYMKTLKFLEGQHVDLDHLENDLELMLEFDIIYKEVEIYRKLIDLGHKEYTGVLHAKESVLEEVSQLIMKYMAAGDNCTLIHVFRCPRCGDHLKITMTKEKKKFWQTTVWCRGKCKTQKLKVDLAYGPKDVYEDLANYCQGNPSKLRWRGRVKKRKEGN